MGASRAEIVGLRTGRVAGLGTVGGSVPRAVAALLLRAVIGVAVLPCGVRRPACGLFGGLSAAPLGATSAHLFGLRGLARLVLPARAGGLLLLSLLDLGIATRLGALGPGSGLVFGFIDGKCSRYNFGSVYRKYQSCR